MAQVRASLILVLALVPALWSCTPAAAPEPSPLSKAALAAVRKTPGVPREALARRIDALFTGLPEDETRAVIVLHDGKTVAERYAPGYHENTRFISWSMAKTITAAMIAIVRVNRACRTRCSRR